MLVIRLARTGRTKYPTYRIVAAESARAATGKYVELLGHYNPHTKELVIQKEAIEKRLANGAQPSNSVVKLLQREKVEVPEWVKLTTKNRKPKKVAEEKPEKPAPEASANEAPAEEGATEEGATEEVAAETPAEQPAEAEAPAAEEAPAEEPTPETAPEEPAEPEADKAEPTDA